jgi:hypothetical protein
MLESVPAHMFLSIYSKWHMSELVSYRLNNFKRKNSLLNTHMCSVLSMHMLILYL